MAIDGTPGAGLTKAQLAEEVTHLSTPDQLKTPFGDLEFFDGVPRAESVQTIFDALDLLRGIDAFLTAVPGASLVAMRRGLRSAGIDSPGKVGYTDPRANSASLFLTPNTETTYGTTFLDLKAWGPTVIEAPPQSLCVVDDFWFRYVADMGIAGPDRGAGGKYLFLPPGYDGDRPDGYFTFESPTFTNWVVLRTLGGVPAMKQTRIYPLSDAASPDDTTFVNIADVLQNTVHANDFTFFEEIAQLVAEEPASALDAERAGTLAAIGIAHDAPFAPDDRLRGILDDAARIGAAISRALVYKPRDPEAYFWEGSSWKNAFVGGSYEFLQGGARNLDARTQFHYFATVITPAMAHAQVGAGSAYAYTAEDADGHVLDGSATYSLRIPADPPAKNFWSVDLYDTQTRSLLQSTPYPALSSLEGTVQAEDDGSYLLWFGPTAPQGRESNWIPTVPGKSWFPILRLYGPLEPWFDKTWQLPEIQKAGIMTDLDTLAAQAYLYGFPLVFDLEQVVRYTTTGVGANPRAAFNQFSHARSLASAADTFVSINNDTVYSMASLDLGVGPLRLSVPASDRYYVLQFVDAWTDNFAYIGTRGTGNGAGEFLVVPPGWEGDAGGLTIVHAPTRIVSIVGRWSCAGVDDLPAVHALQDAMTLTPVDADAAAAGIPVITPQGDDVLDFWEKYRVWSQAFPPAPRDAALQASFAALGLTGDVPVSELADEQQAALRAGARAGEGVMTQAMAGSAAGAAPGAWSQTLHVFDYNLDFFEVGTKDDAAWKIADPTRRIGERAVAAKAGLWGNHGYEAAYVMTFQDADGRPLTGEHEYELRLSPPPPVGAFWSVTMYALPDFYLVDNEIDRYSVGDRTPGIVTDADGGLTIRIGRTRPSDPVAAANWLPAPAGAFRPILRMYMPGDAVLDGTYAPPPITRLDG